MTEELKPCPMCNSLDISIFYWDNALVWRIVCLHCGLEKMHVDKLFLINWWNNRPIEDALLAENIILKQKLGLALMYISGTKLAGMPQATEVLEMIDRVKE